MRRDPGLHSKYGRKIKLTDKASDLVFERKRKDYERSYKKLHDEMQVIYGFIQTNERRTRIERHYQKWLSLLKQFYDAEYEYRVILYEDELHDHEEIFSERQKNMELFQEVVSEYFCKSTTKRKPAADDDRFDSVSQASARSKVSTTSVHTNASVIRLQEKRQSELAEKVAALEEKQRIEMERQHLANQIELTNLQL